MFQDIRTQKIIFSNPSVTKIKGLERKQGNNQNRSFNKQLQKKDGESKKKKERHPGQQTEIICLKKNKLDRWSISIEQQDAQKINKIEEERKLNFIDILV